MVCAWDLCDFISDHMFQDAEMASLQNSPDAIRLYDVAVKYVSQTSEYIG